MDAKFIDKNAEKKPLKKSPFLPLCKRGIAAVLFLCAGPLVVKAEEILLWENCVREAAQNHPELASAAEKTEQARAEKKGAESQLWPQIALSGSGQRGQFLARNLAPGGPGGIPTSQTGTILNDIYAYKAAGKQILFDGFKISNNAASASKKLSASEYGRAVVSSNIRLQLREAFVRLFRAQELLSLAGDIAGRRQKNLKLVSLRYKGGREHRGALLTAEAQLSQAEFEISQAKRSIELSQIKLVRELGRGRYSPVRAKGDFEVSAANKTRPDFEFLADNTPLLKKLVALKEAAQSDLTAAKADFYPKVYLDASAGRAGFDFPPGYTEWLAGLSLSLPLLDGGRRAADVSKSQALLRQVRAEERRERDKVISVLAETWLGLEDAVEERAVKEKFLRAAEERANIAAAQYSTGLIFFNEWIIIEDSLVMSQKLFLDSKVNGLIKEAYWVQAKGGTLEND